MQRSDTMGTTVEDDDEEVVKLEIGDEVPNFEVGSQVGTIRLHDLIMGKWAIIVTFYRDFDPVGTSELGMLAKLADEFEARNIQLIAVSRDTVSNHRRWLRETQELQECVISFPVLADTDGLILQSLGTFTAKGRVDARRATPLCSSSFVVDIDRRIQLISQSPRRVGRNFYELLRSYDAMQIASYHQVVTPANWCQGEDVFVEPELTSKAATEVFPKGFVELKPWFRVTPPPDTS